MSLPGRRWRGNSIQGELPLPLLDSSCCVWAFSDKCGLRPVEGWSGGSYAQETRTVGHQGTSLPHCKHKKEKKGIVDADKKAQRKKGGMHVTKLKGLDQKIETQEVRMQRF